MNLRERVNSVSDETLKTATPGLEGFRHEIRAWLEQAEIPTLPPDPSNYIPLLRAWQRTLYEAGFVGVHWPTEYGGRGLSVLHHAIVAQELARAGAPAPVGKVGIDVIGPVIVEFGSEMQKSRLLQNILSGEDIWCLGFSEPGYGSDLSAVKTRAERTDTGYVISGQKVWTSFAEHATWCVVLARTDSTAPQHRGLTYFLVPMNTPGIEVRPILQMTGDTEFCEVFFDAVEVQLDSVLGEVNEGWRYTVATLDNERGPFIMRRYAELGAWAEDLYSGVRDLDPDPDLAEDIGGVAVLVDVLGAAALETASRMASGTHTTEFGSVDKLLFSQIEQEMFTITNRLLGAYRPGIPGRPHGLDPVRWSYGYLYSRAASIYSGTDQIQLNIIADRVLRLPRTGT